jgi:ferredoxin-type protein NapF
MGLIVGTIEAGGMTLGRADLIRCRFRGGAVCVRPPWALPAFLDRCTCCGDCAQVCPQAIIVHGNGGHPQIDFARGGCTFCGACVAACASGALDRSRGRPWSWRATVGERCLEPQGIACRLCEDACEVSAIRFRPARGGGSRVTIDQGQCTGCGACVGRCPETAIVMRELAT